MNLEATFSNELPNMDVPVLANQLGLSIHHLCTDTGCSLEDLQVALDDRDRWQETVREHLSVSTTNSLEMYSYGPPHMAVQKRDDQHEHTFSSYVRIRDAVLKTYLGRWTIGRSGERGSGISVLPARYDDDDDVYIYLTPPHEQDVKQG